MQNKKKTKIIILQTKDGKQTDHKSWESI